MSTVRNGILAALMLAASHARAGDGEAPKLAGTWGPATAEIGRSDPTVLVFAPTGRFAALVSGEELDVARGSWNLGEDGGEVVLAFDGPSGAQGPGTTRYLQMLLVGDELRPYPGMADRSPIARASWRRIDEVVVGSSDGPAPR
jgi:hypothetical protein